LVVNDQMFALRMLFRLGLSLTW